MPEFSITTDADGVGHLFYGGVEVGTIEVDDDLTIPAVAMYGKQDGANYALTRQLSFRARGRTVQAAETRPGLGTAVLSTSIGSSVATRDSIPADQIDWMTEDEAAAWWNEHGGTGVTVERELVLRRLMDEDYQRLLGVSYDDFAGTMTAAPDPFGVTDDGLPDRYPE